MIVFPLSDIQTCLMWLNSHTLRNVCEFNHTHLEMLTLCSTDYCLQNDDPSEAISPFSCRQNHRFKSGSNILLCDNLWIRPQKIRPNLLMEVDWTEERGEEELHSASPMNRSSFSVSYALCTAWWWKFTFLSHTEKIFITRLWSSEAFRTDQFPWKHSKKMMFFFYSPLLNIQCIWSVFSFFFFPYWGTKCEVKAEIFSSGASHAKTLWMHRLCKVSTKLCFNFDLKRICPETSIQVDTSV